MSPFGLTEGVEKLKKADATIAVSNEIIVCIPGLSILNTWRIVQIFEIDWVFGGGTISAFVLLSWAPRRFAAASLLTGSAFQPRCRTALSAFGAGRPALLSRAPLQSSLAQRRMQLPIDSIALCNLCSQRRALREHNMRIAQAMRLVCVPAGRGAPPDHRLTPEAGGQGKPRSGFPTRRFAFGYLCGSGRPEPNTESYLHIFFGSI